MIDEIDPFEKVSKLDEYNFERITELVGEIKSAATTPAEILGFLKGRAERDDYDLADLRLMSIAAHAALADLGAAPRWFGPQIAAALCNPEVIDRDDLDQMIYGDGWLTDLCWLRCRWPNHPIRNRRWSKLLAAPFEFSRAAEVIDAAHGKKNRLIAGLNLTELQQITCARLTGKPAGDRLDASVKSADRYRRLHANAPNMNSASLDQRRNIWLAGMIAHGNASDAAMIYQAMVGKEIARQQIHRTLKKSGFTGFPRTRDDKGKTGKIQVSPSPMCPNDPGWCGNGIHPHHPLSTVAPIPAEAQENQCLQPIYDPISHVSDLSTKPVDDPIAAEPLALTFAERARLHPEGYATMVETLRQLKAVYAELAEQDYASGINRN